MNPFIAGSWVRGPNFFGRQDILQGILEADRHALWLLGMRRVGKTSVLKQLEWLTLRPPYNQAFVPVYWDMQGSHDVRGLRDSLLESVEDAEEALEEAEISLDSLERDDLFRLLRSLTKSVERGNRKLLLLCDEAEELIQVASTEETALRKLRRLLLQGETLRCVMAATKRLGDVLGARTEHDTSPFLHGFLPPLYLNHFPHEVSRRLLGRGGFPDEVIEQGVRLTGGHPYLLQLLGRRMYDGASLEQVTEEMKSDELIQAFFRIDFSYLIEAERRVVLQAIERSKLSPSQLQSDSGYPSDYLRTLLHSLEKIGYLHQDQGGYAVANAFFQHWLRNEHLPQPKPMASPLPTLAEGSRLAHYMIARPLGSGGMGAVYSAVDTHLERPVALKIIPLTMTPSKALQNRFLREARALSSLKHPGIVSVYEFNEASGIWYLAMELVQGKTLREHIQNRLLPLDEALRLGSQIATVLAYAHEEGVIHRDIKPANIMLSAGGSIKLLDFGLAKLLGEKSPEEHPTESLLTRSGQLVGTVAYMSPEQAKGGPIGPETDQFSFGIVLYEMLAGSRPFQGATDYSTLHLILSETPRPIAELRPETPPDLRDIVERLLSKEPARRYPSMANVADALQTVQAHAS